MTFCRVVFPFRWNSGRSHSVLSGVKVGMGLADIYVEMFGFSLNHTYQPLLSGKANDPIC